MASEYEGPGLRVPVTQNEIHRWILFSWKNTRQRSPPGGYPPTHGAHAEPGRERGPGPRPGPVRRAPPEGRGVYGRGGRKREIAVRRGLPAVCKRKYEGAELRYGRPKPAAANANPLAHEFGGPQLARLDKRFLT